MSDTTKQRLHSETRGRPRPGRASAAATLPVFSVTPFTMLDFPGRTACIVWFSGCNMRCPYCHNPQIVKGKGRGSIETIMEFLHKRRDLLDGVVISGGEASVYPGLTGFIQNVKKLGYAVKLDTNGLRPSAVRGLLAQNLLDYVALDYKAPPAKFKKVTGVEGYDLFSETLNLLCAQETVPFEIRTTVHTALLEVEDISNIIHDLEKRGYKGTYYVQNFRSDNKRQTLGRLPVQKSPLPPSLLPQSCSFRIQFRNF